MVIATPTASTRPITMRLWINLQWQPRILSISFEMAYLPSPGNPFKYAVGAAFEAFSRQAESDETSSPGELFWGIGNNKVRMRRVICPQHRVARYPIA